ncbi:restriction endonuclease subunit S [Aeromonas veronii]|uniref:restriction endonuclease subunit S n=1 Tax=Aeromonas veronii TaxID=654 RepID=UPI003D19499B
MSNFYTAKLQDIAMVLVSNVDKKTYSGQKKVVLCNYMDVYSNDYITADLAFMESTASDKEISQFTLKKGDIVITKDSESPFDIGVPAVVVDDIPNLVCGYHLAIIRPDLTQVDPYYLAKQLSDDACVKYFGKVAAGSTRFGLSNGAIKETPIMLTGLPTQRKIGHISRNVNAQIVATEALVSKYQRVKQGIMTDLFSRGIDTATGQLRPSVHDAPELYQETSIGLLPKEWEVCPLGSISSIASGITLGKDLSKMTTVRVPYLRVANVQDGYLDLTEVKFVDVPEAEATKYLLLYGDVLMNEGGDFDKLGRGAVWRNEVEGCCHQNHVFRVRTVQAELRPEFLAYWSASTYGKRYFILNSKQSTNLASINSTQLKAFPVAKPSVDEQSAIEDRLQSIDRMIDMCQLDVDKLKQQKSGLMRDLLTGKVPVSA